MNLDATTQQNIDRWLAGAYDGDTKAEIRQLIDSKSEEELTNAFYKDLEFGTGGMRGIMGTGSNRVNRYTLGRATQGFANYLNERYRDAEEISVVIAHDCRNNSQLFANLVADVFSANGITVNFFDGMRPTPELSYAVRTLGAQGGVMLTASHNPREYNGYKAYGEDGGQLVAPADTEVMAHVSRVEDVSDIKFERQPDLVHVVGKGIDDEFLKAILDASVDRRAIAEQGDMPIVFSPIHGTGAVMVPPALELYGFTNIITVEEQMIEDGDFPTVVYPNPEEEEALKMALDKAAETNADLVMATDPDADRVGIAVRKANGELTLLNGNQTAVLLVHYVLSAHERTNDLREGDYIVKTVVTSYLLDAIAKRYGVDCYNTLTGFKYIGELMTKFGDERRYLVGGEESYGYLVGDHARDKDAVVSCAIIAEMAAFYRNQGKTLHEALLDIYAEYGVYRERLVAIKKEGKRGADEIVEMMRGFRNNPPVELGGSKVVMIKDYKSGDSRDLATGTIEKIELPSSNVLQFYTADGTIVSARPSGTEPKIKFYCSVNAPLEDVATYSLVEQSLDTKLDRVLEDLQS